MTPGERAVVEAAIRYVETVYNADPTDLIEAVDALKHERETTPPEQRREMEITWGQVVEGDEVLSPKTGKWYGVTGAVRHIGAPTCMIHMQGIAKGVPKSVSDPVKVRRGVTGEVVDMFASVLWSGSSAPDPRAIRDAQREEPDA